MRSRVARWGNSLAVRLPKSMTSQLGLSEDGLVEIEIVSGRLMVTPVAAQPSLDELVGGITDENRHSEVDWGPAVGLEFGAPST